MLEKDKIAGNGAQTQSAPRPEGAPALHGIRVIDLTQFEAGTACTETLAWLGADVIKVEEPSKGDPGRGVADAPSPDGKASIQADSFYFIMLNANKRSVTANLKSEGGKEVLRELIKTADVFVENFAPGVIERMGFDYDAVRELNPRIVYARIKGFSPGSPYEKFLAFDAVAQSAGGSLSVTGEPDGRPLRPGYHVGDSGTGIHTALGIVAALYQRQFTGKGQQVRVAMQEAVINFGRASFAAGARLGEACHRHGNATFAVSSPCDLYPCKGGGPNDFCFIYASRTNQDHWNRVLKVIGREDLKDEPRFASADLRYAVTEEVDKLISDWTATRDKFTVMKLLGEAGVPCSAIYDTESLTADEFLRKRGMMVTMKHPVRGDLVMPGFPVQMSDSNVPVEAAPLHGEDTDEIYRELLGMAPEKIAELRTAKAI